MVTRRDVFRLVGVPVALVLVAIVGLSCAGGETPPQPATSQPPETMAPTTQPTGTTAPTTQPAAVSWSADGVVAPGEYAANVDQRTYRLFWSSTETTIRMAIQADTQGWVAVGFQPGRRMKDADIVFGMLVDGSAVVLDCYSTGDFGPHRADVNQGGTDDLLSWAGARTDAMTTFEFERPLETTDVYDVPLQRGASAQLIWAYGTSDDEGMQHSARGYVDIVP